MKILKFVGLLVGVLIVLLLVGMIFLPSESHVERSIAIDASPEVIFPEINDFNKINSWSPWFRLDPNAKYTYEGGTSGVGAKMSWVSEHKNVGSGSQWIVESIPDQMVKSNLVFEGFEDPAEANLILEPDGEQTKVTWTFDSNMSGFSKYFGLFMDGMLGPQYETGLQNLKAIAESKPTYSVDIAVEEVQAIGYLGIVETIPMDQLEQVGAKMGQLYGELLAFIGKNNIEKAGHPMTVYPNWGGSQFEIECAIPVTQQVSVSDDRISYKTTVAGAVVKAVHMGDYQELEATHLEIDRYVKDHHLSAAGAPYEIYVTDPGTEVDTSKWVTHVYYPIEK